MRIGLFPLRSIIFILKKTNSTSIHTCVHKKNVPTNVAYM